MGKKSKIGIGIGVIFLLFILVVASVKVPEDLPEKSAKDIMIQQQKDLLIQQELAKPLSERAIDWSYRDLLRNIDDYKGEIIFVTGKVQNIQRDVGSLNLCTSGKKEYGVFSCDQFMFVEVNGITTWLEDDLLEGFVKVKKLSETGTKNAFTKGEWIGSGEYVPKVIEMELKCTNC